MRHLSPHHKASFSMIELIMVIIVVGILAAVTAPRLQKSNINDAANQVLRHIRYTQHLAMNDDKYTPMPLASDDWDEDGDLNDQTKGMQYWYKKMWTIKFDGFNGTEGYAIFSDHPTDSSGNAQYDGNGNLNEFALNPLDPSKYLSADSNILDFTDGVVDARATKSMMLEEEFGVTDITLSGGCANSRISFDNLGRPYQGFSTGKTDFHPYDNLITATCVVTLTGDGSQATISIEPYTGYAHR